MDRIERHLRQIQTRVLSSMAVFVVFTILAVWFGVQGKTLQNESILAWMIPLVVAFLVLPRSALGVRWPEAQNDDQQARIDMVREQLRTLEVRLTMIRFAYFTVMLVVLLLLPMLGI